MSYVEKWVTFELKGWERSVTCYLGFGGENLIEVAVATTSEMNIK